MKEIYRVVENKKTGFTLIELLAVILILAIIALIAIPAVTKIVEEAKKQSFKVTATNVVDAADKDCNILLQQGESVAKSYTISDYEITNGQNLSISGKLPLQGSVAVNNTCDVAIAVNNKKWCATKNYTDDKVTLSEYVDGNCNYSGDGGNTGGDLLVDKIQELRGSELTAGVNLGTDEYDLAISSNGSTVGYYTDKSFTGSNPNNYITVDGKEFRILSLTSQGITVVGDADGYITDEGYGSTSISARFYNNFNILGLVRLANFFTSVRSGSSNSFDDSDGFKIDYGKWGSGEVTDSYSMLSFYDYEQAINRNNYASCLKNSSAGDARTAFTDCAQPSWLGNNVYLNIGFYFYGTGAVSPGYLDNGKFAIADSYGNGDDGVCTDCTKKFKVLVRNDSYYVSGTGTKADPFIYESAYDPGNFSQDSCYLLDGTGSVIQAFDNSNTDCSKNITIPASINGKPITEIAPYAFQNSSISYVDFSKATNLVSIGESAFAGNVISEPITLPQNITQIENGVFANNAISGELIIPSKITSIGVNAFASNEIETLTFASGSALTNIGWQAFSENYSLAGTVDLPATITSMDDSVFCWTNISTLNIPNGVSGLSSGALNCTDNLNTINVDQLYNGLDNYPWGNSTATINWLRAVTYSLTYDNGQVAMNNACLKSGNYIGNCTVTISSSQVGYKLVSYKLNGVSMTSNTFVMPNENATITDIVLAQGYTLESAHPYSDNMDQTYTATVPGATKIQVTFDDSTFVENGYDKIYLTDGTGTQVGTSSYYTSSGLANKVFIVNGNTINVRLTSDSSATYYGFKAEIVKYQ